MTFTSIVFHFGGAFYVTSFGLDTILSLNTVWYTFLMLTYLLFSEFSGSEILQHHHQNQHLKYVDTDTDYRIDNQRINKSLRQQQQDLEQYPV